MAVSKYFNNTPYRKTNEQNLFEDLVCEAIHISGVDIFYIPRSIVSPNDLIFGENITSLFDRAYVIEMYLVNVDGHQGEGDLFSKFGLQIRDLSNFLVARRTFERFVPSAVLIHPNEGDLLYVPFLSKLYEIRFVEPEYEQQFHTLGQVKPYLYNLRCETFRYSHERLDTGVSEIDILERDVAYAVSIELSLGSGNYQLGEIVYQGANLEFSTAHAEVSDWEPLLSSLKVINLVGNFANAANIIGVTSNTRYNVVSVDTIGDYQPRDLKNNGDIQTLANTFLDLSENNPFGVP